MTSIELAIAAAIGGGLLFFFALHRLFGFSWAKKMDLLFSVSTYQLAPLGDGRDCNNGKEGLATPRSLRKALPLETRIDDRIDLALYVPSKLFSNAILF